ncbi:MAG: hypothetical protein A2445_02430 [Candidatus Jacksonbacteria bacterium RIFOXYC2_FULL_44_29]|nr:MAG: hypothetical protein UW45_C0020G0012 [Parcubacteria group bacterium GW2011_GWC2_44_22]OGY74477.1 MAG: hypothetical protein A2240_02690 [Candidatus Jacksonbacteria bacterium RIFOXYA2_FULL_43_12]OGY77385.1 MAG: hypothetical protein A2295_01640 [Candidatus Jacksonbacteria bacterium RIFOXYB2_FULL_44_15]OGY78157.1 MAG: hypothetical protein A2550_05985 [Candidatus Jacksonbacteria bacterium RIFOXYD2_FULL_43_21]OGY80733.1 MAG: hypothetical protein A2445_02430 [Candidatus Jacksonbacteria bacteri
MANRHHLLLDLGIVAASVIIAVILGLTGVLKDVLFFSQGFSFLGSFVAGIFFTSIFTVAPATVVLGEAAQLNSLLAVAFWGGLGSLLGDLVIFRFIKDRLSEDFLCLLQQSKFEKVRLIFKCRLFKWILPLAGAIIVASPLPDEIGLMLLGLSKTKTWLFIPISFLLNFTGILIIGLIARAVA